MNGRICFSRLLYAVGAASSMLIMAAVVAPTEAAAATCSSVRYVAPTDASYSIEYSFESAVECGQYANGDWWVVAPVRVTSITPDAGGGRNGCEINPSRFNQNPYDSRTSSYNSSTLCSLPQTFSSGITSIVKAASASGSSCSYDGANQCLAFATVLTVVDTAPSNPSNTFRPPWFGTSKPSKTFLVSQLQYDKIPSLPADDPSFDDCCDRQPSVADVATRYRYIQLGDHIDRHTQRIVKPRENFRWQDETHEYHAEMAADNAVALLRLLLNDLDWSNPAHSAALINYVQAGIDMYWIIDRGLVWLNHSMGRKILPTVAAFLLEDSDIAAVAGSTGAPGFGENVTIYHSAHADGGNGKALWGRTPDSEDDYWTLVETRGGDGYRWWGDPYGYVDGAYAYGVNGVSGYQNCCSSMGIKYESLAVRLLGAEEVFDYDPFHEYADRWVEHGYSTENDVCAPYDGNRSNRGVTYGPAPGNASNCSETRTCDCIRGSGRFPEANGTNADRGYYQDSFGNDMWDSFHQCLEPGGSCPGITPGDPPAARPEPPLQK